MLGGRLVETCGALEHPGVHEGLWQVAAQLSLDDVVLLGEQAGRATRGAVAFEPSERLDGMVLLQFGQAHHEAAQQERTFGLMEGAFIVAEPVGVVVGGELVSVGLQGAERSRVVRVQCAPDRW